MEKSNKKKCEYCNMSTEDLLNALLPDGDNFSDLCRECKRRVIKESLDTIRGK